MTPEEAKELAAKYQALADLLAAKAAGKSLQLAWTQFSCGNGITMWATTEYFPTADSDLSKWRIKPEARRMWTSSATNARTENAAEAEEWKNHGHNLTEWMEVLP